MSNFKGTIEAHQTPTGMRNIVYGRMTAAADALLACAEDLQAEGYTESAHVAYAAKQLTNAIQMLEALSFMPKAGKS